MIPRNVLAKALANAEQVAVTARLKADRYARIGTSGGKVAGAGYRRGGVDRAYLAELQQKADDAERAVRDLKDLARASFPEATA